jgi:ankyrin repeat protein
MKEKIILLLFIALAVFIDTGLVFSEDSTFDELKKAILNDDIDLLARHFTEEDLNPELFNYETQESLFLIALESQNAKIVEMFLLNGKDPNTTNYHTRKSPIYISTQMKNYQITNLLLEYGADPTSNASGIKEGDSYLLNMAIIEKNNEFTKLCLERGYNPNNISLSVSWDPPLIIAIKRSNIQATKMFIEYGADITVVNMLNNYMTVLSISILIHGENSTYTKLLKEKKAYFLEYRYKSLFMGHSTTDRLRIREKPTLSAEIIGHLMNGDLVEMIEVTPLAYKIDNKLFPWIRVRHNSIDGWVYGGYIEPNIQNQGFE